MKFHGYVEEFQATAILIGFSWEQVDLGIWGHRTVSNLFGSSDLTCFSDSRTILHLRVRNLHHATVRIKKVCALGH